VLSSSPSFRRGAAWALSLALHLGLTAGVLRVAQASMRGGEAAPSPAASASTAFELPVFTEEAAPASAGEPSPSPVTDPLGAPPVTLGGEHTPRLDTEHAGKGGEAAAEAALHLADKDEQIRRSPDLRDRLEQDQEQRLEAGHRRASWEDRRSTTHPMELTFLATPARSGDEAARRPAAATDPSRGLLASSPPAVIGGPDVPRGAATESTVPLDPSSPARPQLALGAAAASPGIGVQDSAAGADHRASAAIVRARPDVTLAPPSVPAAAVARPVDDRDSEQEVATAVQSLVHASTAGGALGAGHGGTTGGGAAGADGTTGEGSHPAPLGAGDGDVFDIDSRDPRLLPYFRKLHAKIAPLTEHAFPKSALLDLKQGTVILDFVIHPDGSVTVLPPRRPSGIPEFDANCAAAIEKAAPFDPPPLLLTGTTRTLRIRAPFTSTRRW
jgi:TonB family protein